MYCIHFRVSSKGGNPSLPSFQDIARQLSLPDTKLLKWSEEDKSVHPEAAKLGADLLCGEGLNRPLISLHHVNSTHMHFPTAINYVIAYSIHVIIYRYGMYVCVILLL